MITTLSVKFPEKSKGIKKLINKLRSDKVYSEIKKSRGVSVKQVTYISFSGKIRLDKLDATVGAQRNHLLCSAKLVFPENCGYRRFFSGAFLQRLCTNMALAAVKNCIKPEMLKIGIYDPDGDSHDILLQILKYCSDVAVVTNDFSSYNYELEKAMNELGATAVVTKCQSELADRNFVIAPASISETLPIKHDALVLTVKSPSEHINGLVYYKYHIRMPDGFDIIKPCEMEGTYFCSALYTLGGQYELGSLVPVLCQNYSSSQTVSSLCTYLNRFA